MTRKKGIAKIWFDEEKGVLIARTPFSASFVHDIHNIIPQESRRWNRESKVWEIEVDQIDRLQRILGDNYEKVIELGSGSSASSNELFSILTKDDIKAIYKLLAKRYHPDVSSDKVIMAKINQFFQGIK